MQSLSFRFIFLIIISISINAVSQVTDPVLKERFTQMSIQNEKKGLAEPFKGITADGNVQPVLFPLRQTGVSTGAMRKAAQRFLNSLDAKQLKNTKFAVDNDEWRKWMNQDFYIRQGVPFYEMTEKQRTAAFDLMAASLSGKGLKLSKDIMKLNYTLGEINNDFKRYGEWLYWITIMGEPSKTKPWGWQMDGHHLIINYFVLGDQVVMTPLFIGSEPVIADSGKYKGITILQDEQNVGLKMLRSLNDNQKSEAIINPSKKENNNLTEAFKDNVVIDYSGVKASSFTKEQKDQMLLLIKLYVDNMDQGHAKLKMDELEKHLDDTWFTWIGGTDDNSVYYYRIHSPVILIEFDHQRPVGTRKLYGNEVHKQHIHAVIRTPNGNDYGKDLLKQHYKEHPHH